MSELEESVEAYLRWEADDAPSAFTDAEIGRGWLQVKPKNVTWGWDLDALSWMFRQLIPTMIQNDSDSLPPANTLTQWSLGETLPFPPELLRDISQEDIEFLQTWTLDERDKYESWAHLYHGINGQFADKKQEAQKSVRAFRRLPSEVPKARLFLALALCREIMDSRAGTVEALNKDKRSRETIEEERKEVRRAFETLSRLAKDERPWGSWIQASSELIPLKATPNLLRLVREIGPEIYRAMENWKQVGHMALAPPNVHALSRCLCYA